MTHSVDHRARKARFDREIDLEDWILPVLYQRKDARLAPRRMYIAPCDPGDRRSQGLSRRRGR
ncbi:MAG: hypothetical protein GY717_17665 [Rhodobacteraceae bacterium]|nr:hypothetical protein [Paracoccaceae bacterium]